MKFLIAKFNFTPKSGAQEASQMREIAADLLCDIVAEAGFEAFETIENGVNGYIQSTLYHQESLDLALQDWPLDDISVSYSISEAEDKNWNEEWENTGFEPIVIDDAVVVYDAKRTYTPDFFSSYRYSIGIEAQMAFGTGTHQTTRMVIQELLCSEIRGKEVLDCGCGTGILGIFSSKMGATHVAAYDIDEWSVKNTQHNAELNAVDNITPQTGDASIVPLMDKEFDVVLANINRNILLQDMPVFRQSLKEDGGLLIISGFYKDDVEMLIEKAQELGLKPIRQREEDGWCCLSLKTM